MTVTGVKSLSKDRYKVFIDDEYFCTLYKSDLNAYGISEGAEIEPQVCETIRSEVLVKRSKLRAMNLLMKHRFTEAGLMKKLIESGYPEDIAALALDYVRGFGYVDDHAYVRDFMFSHRDDKSMRRMESDLQDKGVSNSVIREVMSEFGESADSIDEIAQIKRLLRKRRFSATGTAKEIQKTYAYLARRGYDTASIRKAINEYCEEES